MVMARAIQRRVWLLYRIGLTASALPAGGSETVQAAAAAALRPGVDWIFPHERDLTLSLALGISPLDVLLSVLGRAGDPASAGRMGPGGFGSRRARLVLSSPTPGARVLHAAGVAYATRFQGLDEVTLVSTGAAAIETGDWHEGLNFAAVHRLPMICLVQDDSEEPSAPLARPESDLIVRRAKGYGMAGSVVDGGDFKQAFAALAEAVADARAGRGPTLLHAILPPLSALTPTGATLPREQLEARAHQDPIQAMRRELEERRILDEATETRIQRDCLSVAEAAVEQAAAAPAPKPAAALDNVLERSDA
jgi:2-oxoisovalerate dehydrogenase E1 component alpha subunit